MEASVNQVTTKQREGGTRGRVREGPFRVVPRSADEFTRTRPCKLSVVLVVVGRRRMTQKPNVRSGPPANSSSSNVHKNNRWDYNNSIPKDDPYRFSIF